jgi:LysM repeat protein
MLRRLLITILLVSVQLYNVKSEEAFYLETAFFAQEDDFFLHTVESGQTVYSISKMYNISVEEIYNLNPGSDVGIKTGAQLKIPQNSGSYFYHTIQPQETLYSVSRKFQMKGEDILDVNPGLSVETFTAGKTIRIPTNRVTTPIEGPNEDYNQVTTNALLFTQMKPESISTIKTALLLPFGLREGTNPKNASSNRMVEYYEGFLLALEDIKKKGISVDLQVYDIGSEAGLLPAILKTPAMQDVNLIIGGMSDKQIQLISNFSHEKNIPYVIPFSRSDEPLMYYNIYQVNTPQSYLYSKASVAFCDKYKKSNIIFYVPNPAGNKTDFIEIVKKDLTARKIPYSVIGSTNNISSEITKALSDSKNNVFVPADDTSETLLKLMAYLKNIAESKPQLSVSLFGYPTWQIYSMEHPDDFFYLNATFFSIFYANPTSQKVKSFYNNYLSWYSRELINTFPKFGIFGYDTGMFFIQLLHKYGTSYDVNINKLSYNGVQTDFYFERANNWGGFINTNIYLVEFTPDFTIVSSRVK